MPWESKFTDNMWFFHAVNSVDKEGINVLVFPIASLFLYIWMLINWIATDYGIYLVS